MKRKGISVFTKGDRAFMPSTVETAEGIYMDCEPVEIVTRWDTRAMAEAMKRIMDRGVVLDRSIRITRDYNPDPSTVRLYGYKSWRQFSKGTELWVLTETEHGFEMYAHGTPNSQGAWIMSTDQPPDSIRLGPDIGEDELLERFVAFINRARDTSTSSSSL